MKKNKQIIKTMIVLLLGVVINSQAQSIKPEALNQLKFRHIGPVGNRVISVAGIPGDPMIYYVGAASGGIWKTVDGGLHWNPIFDGQPAHSIGSLAIAPTDTDIIYAGTGEHFIRSNISLGDGVYKSMDGGTTWKHMGLTNTARISRIIVDPSNSDIVYVAALGHAYTPQKERGIYKTVDGGETWEQLLHPNDNTGASDLVMDPENPRILFAGMWQLELHPWQRISGGPGSGIYKTTDAGKTWKKLEGNGLPEGEVGKISLTMSKASPKRLYALIETGDGIPLDGKPTNTGELWRSEDRGQSFALINYNRDLSGRGAYYTRTRVAPDNANEIYFMSAGFLVSIDGGVTTERAGEQPNWDHHDMWIDPTNGNRQVVVGDGGLGISHNRGKSWDHIQLPIAQLYHVTTDNEIPYNVYTNMQDGPSMKGPSQHRSNGNSYWGSFIPTGLWNEIGGGESGFATPDPENSNIVWSSASGYGALGGVVTRYNVESDQFRHVEVWPEYTGGSVAKDVKYRFQWTFPLLVSPHDHETVYVTSQHVHRTNNGGQSWELISPDLTKNDTSKQGFSGGLTGDNIGVEYANVISAFEESPMKAGLLWAGTNDGLVHNSQDHGSNWQDVSENIPDMPEYGVVRNIESSSHDEGTAYITVDAHEMGDFRPYVYRTTNYGKSWKKITEGVPASNYSFARMVKEDPFKSGLLYLGTENALYFSYDSGDHWHPLKTNLPSTPMYWMDIPEHYNDLVVGTYGRGIWILDDLSPLQQFSKEVEQSDIYLFKPKTAYRLHPGSFVMQMFQEPSFGDNPPRGAALHYWLSEEEQGDSIKMVIKDSDGSVLRTIEHQGKPGFNRVWWDFMEDPTTKIVMRTKPLYADWFEMDDDNTRPSLVRPFAKMVPPGNYTVSLYQGDTKIQENTLEILKDPNSEGSLEDIGLQYELLTKIETNIEDLSKTINEIELVRRRFKDLEIVVSEKKEVSKRLKEVSDQIVTLENKMVQIKYTGTGQDRIRLPYKLLGKFSYLTQAVGSVDFRPTNQDVEVFDTLDSSWEQVKQEWNAFKTKELKVFENYLDQQGIGTVSMP